MTAADATPVQKALVVPPPPPEPPRSDMIAAVARQSKVSPFRQFYEILRLTYSPARLTADDYYKFRIYDPALSLEQKRRFVGNKANRALNDRVTRDWKTPMMKLLTKKVPSEAHFRSKGLATTELVATVNYDPPGDGVPNLTSAEELAQFLRTTDTLPLFGKPELGSLSVGSVRLASRDDKDDTLRLANGRVVGIPALAREIVTDYPGGYLFQRALAQHEDVSRVAGPSLATVRLVTIHDGTAPQVLYALWKLPAKGAMSDNFWQAGSLIAELDTATGKVLSVRRGVGPTQETLHRHPMTDAKFEGLHLPRWNEVVALGLAAHADLPDPGLIGFDIGLTVDGPVIVEANTNPFHMLYQIATGRGILEPPMGEIFDRAASGRAGTAAAA